MKDDERELRLVSERVATEKMSVKAQLAVEAPPLS